ncbi:hypothetical protein ACRFB9_28045 [Klebsiella pneumoniae]
MMGDVGVGDVGGECGRELGEGFKEVGGINCGESNWSLGGIGECNGYSSMKSKKR